MHINPHLQDDYSFTAFLALISISAKSSVRLNEGPGSASNEGGIMTVVLVTFFVAFLISLALAEWLAWIFHFRSIRQRIARRGRNRKISGPALNTKQIK